MKYNVNKKTVRSSMFNVEYFSEMTDFELGGLIKRFYREHKHEKYDGDITGFVLWFDSEMKIKSYLL